MSCSLVVSILITGLSGLIAQVILLRELLINFQGNELTIGIILANWLICEAIGAWTVGKIVDQSGNPFPIGHPEDPDVMSGDEGSHTDLFIILQILFSIVLPVSLYLTRTFKYYLGIPVSESMGLPLIYLCSLAVIFSPAFLHAGLFSCGCKINRSIAKIYSLETAGTIAGGVLLTYLLLPRLNSFQIVFLVSLLNLIVGLIFNPPLVPPFTKGGKMGRFPFTKGGNGGILKCVIFIYIVIILYLFISQDINKLHHFSLHKQFRTGQVVENRNSPYGNVTLIKNRRQYTLFYNGIPSITLPHGDITLFEEFGQLPLLFHNQPKEILVISGGAGGLIDEILKHPVEKIDYVELDPVVIETIRKIEILRRPDPKVKIFQTDAMAFVRNTRNKYDIIFIGLSGPLDLSSNRFFTAEFFSLVKKNLNPQGIVVFRLPGSLTYISNELKNLNGCILNAARQNYRHIRVIPGDYNIFLASDSKRIMGITPEIIANKINKLGIKTNLLIPDYLNYRLAGKWARWFNSALSNRTAKINQNTRPYAVFQMLVLWNKQFSRHTSNALDKLGNLSIKQILFLIILITLIMYGIFKRWPKLTKLNIAYSIFTTGFFGMLINLILIFSFQISHGYLYYAMGLLISLFMAGAAIGSMIAVHCLCPDKIGATTMQPLKLFIKLETIIIIFSLIIAIITSVYSRLPYPVFSLLFVIAGMLVGSQFSLASKIYLSEIGSQQIGQTAGLLYFSDLIGGCIAGIIGGVLLLPVLGLSNSCVGIILWKSSSLLLIINPAVTSQRRLRS